MTSLVRCIQDTWTGCYVIISQAPPRADNKGWAAIQSLVNCNLEMQYANDDHVSIIRHDDFSNQGALVDDLYLPDNVHPNAYGTTRIAMKLKSLIHKTFNL